MDRNFSSGLRTLEKEVSFARGNVGPTGGALMGQKKFQGLAVKKELRRASKNKGVERCKGGKLKFSKGPRVLAKSFEKEFRGRGTRSDAEKGKKKRADLCPGGRTKSRFERARRSLEGPAKAVSPEKKESIEGM